MNLPLLFASPSERRLLPGGHFRGPTPFVIAIMTFAMMLIAAAGLALSNVAGIVAASVENRFVIQVPSGSGGLGPALAAARSAPGVQSAKAVAEAEMRRTLERWLGPDGGGGDLPVPALIHLDLKPGADRAAIAGIVGRASPGSRLTAHSEKVGPILRSMRALQWLVLALVLLIAAATSAAVVLAARGALDTHRSTIEVMHGIGATDVQVTRLFQRKIALDAIGGSLAGALAASVILLLLGGAKAGLAGEILGSQPLQAGDWVWLAMLPLIGVALATGVARAAVLAALRRNL